MAQHGQTLSNNLIYVPYSVTRERWDRELAESKERFLHTAAGRRWLKEQQANEAEKERAERENKRRLEALRQARREGKF